MKKFYVLILLLFVFTFSSSAQITLSQNNSNEIIAGTSACTTEEPDFITGDNSYYRAFDIFALGYTDFTVQEITFGVELVEDESPDFAIEVILYENSGADFPDGNLVEVNRVSVPLTAADTDMLKTIPFSGTVNERQLVVEISIPDENAAGNTTTFFIGGNNFGETGPTYTFSASCGDTKPVTFESLGIGGQHLILEVVGDATLSTNNTEISNVSIVPNPATDFVDITLSDNDVLKKVEVFSAQGQLLINSSNHRLDISKLSTGVYLIKLETEKGTSTKQIIKQ